MAGKAISRTDCRGWTGSPQPFGPLSGRVACWHLPITPTNSYQSPSDAEDRHPRAGYASIGSEYQIIAMPPQGDLSRRTSCVHCARLHVIQSVRLFRMGQTSVTGYFSILIMTSLFVGSCRVNGILIHCVSFFSGRITSILPTRICRLISPVRRRLRYTTWHTEVLRWRITNKYSITIPESVSPQIFKATHSAEKNTGNYIAPDHPACVALGVGKERNRQNDNRNNPLSSQRNYRSQ